MHYIYFDTSAYNHIFRHKNKETLISNLRNFCEGNNCEILLSALNFEEFAHTQEDGIREALFDIAYQVCKHVMLPHQKELIREELISLCKGKTLRFEDVFSETDFKKAFKSVKDRAFYKQIPNTLFNELKGENKGFLANNKIAQKTWAHLWDKERDMSYERFEEHFFKNEETKRFVEEICAIALQGISLNQYPKANLYINRLPGLFALTQYFCALAYNQQIKLIKPKFGDGVDMNHSVYFYYTSMFVTADSGFFDVLDLMKRH